MIQYKEWSRVPINRRVHYHTVFEFAGIKRYKFEPSGEMGTEVVLVDATDEQMELAFQTSIVLTAKLKEALQQLGWNIDNAPPLTIYYGISREELVDICGELETAEN